MTHKDMAEWLRKAFAQKDWERVAMVADELDPPRPEPGTVVWWRTDKNRPWDLGATTSYGIIPAGTPNACWNWGAAGLEYRPARILATDEVAVPLHVARHCCEDMDAADYMAAEIARAESAAQEARR